MAVHPFPRRLVIVPHALATRRQEGFVTGLRVLQRKVEVLVTIEPKRRLSPRDAALQEALVDRTAIPADPAVFPTTDEIDDSVHLGMLSAPGNTQYAAARITADGDTAAIDERLGC